MGRWFRLFMTFVFLSGCATVPSGKKLVSARQMEAVEDAVAQACNGSDCKVRACWWETPMKMACNVDFDFVGTRSQRRVLEIAAKNLGDDGVRADLCGEHSPKTIFVTTAAIVVAVLVIIALIKDSKGGGAPTPQFSGADFSTQPSNQVAASVAATNAVYEKTYPVETLVPAVCSRRDR